MSMRLGDAKQSSKQRIDRYEAELAILKADSSIMRSDIKQILATQREIREDVRRLLFVVGTHRLGGDLESKLPLVLFEEVAGKGGGEVKGKEKVSGSVAFDSSESESRSKNSKERSLTRKFDEALDNIISGFEKFDNHRFFKRDFVGKKYYAGPFVITYGLEYPDLKLVLYLFNSSLPKSEVVARCMETTVSRDDVLSITPKRQMSSKVIDFYVDILTMEERYQMPEGARFWWLPTKLTCAVVKDTSQWQKWVGPVDHCQKIFMPLIVGDHWYLGVVNMLEHNVMIFQKNDGAADSCAQAIIQNTLRMLELVVNLKHRVMWNFTMFDIVQGPQSADCSENDCGLRVAMLIGEPHGSCSMWEAIVDDDRRVQLTLKLAQSIHNSNAITLQNLALEHFERPSVFSNPKQRTNPDLGESSRGESSRSTGVKRFHL